ncbi:hypothetical protein PSHT_09469, partial [Puccinia striiformis]
WKIRPHADQRNMQPEVSLESSPLTLGNPEGESHQTSGQHNLNNHSAIPGVAENRDSPDLIDEEFLELLCKAPDISAEQQEQALNSGAIPTVTLTDVEKELISKKIKEAQIAGDDILESLCRPALVKTCLADPVLLTVDQASIASAIAKGKTQMEDGIIYAVGTVSSHQDVGFVPFFDENIKELKAPLPLTIFEREWQKGALKYHIQWLEKHDAAEGSHSMINPDTGRPRQLVRSQSHNVRTGGDSMASHGSHLMNYSSGQHYQPGHFGGSFIPGPMNMHLDYPYKPNNNTGNYEQTYHNAGYVYAGGAPSFPRNGNNYHFPGPPQGLQKRARGYQGTNFKNGYVNRRAPGKDEGKAGGQEVNLCHVVYTMLGIFV